MTDEEKLGTMASYAANGGRFVVRGHDYRFEGTIQSIWRKRNGNLRCIVESDDGVCLIQSLKNVEPAGVDLPQVPDWEE